MNIYVGNLAYNATEDTIRVVFEEFGAVTSVKIISDKFTGKPRGFAFVEMASDDEAQKAISDATGITPVWFRPPYGIFDFTCSGVVKKRGLSIVLWTVLSGDYSEVSSENIVKTVKPFIRPGAIQVFHDTLNGGGT